MSSPNHDGEASENWDAFCYPLGDAREALLAFAALLTDIAMNVRVRLRWNFEIDLNRRRVNSSRELSADGSIFGKFAVFFQFLIR